MAAYCGSIGSVNVLEFVSTDLFDESHENPFLLQASNHPSSPSAKPKPANAPSPLHSPTGKHASVRFADLPLDDDHDSTRTVPSPVKPVAWTPSTSLPKQPSVVIPTPSAYQPGPQGNSPRPYVPKSLSPPSPSPLPHAARPSITITLPLPRQSSDESYTSSSTVLAEEAELHKLLYSLAQLGLSQQAPVTPFTTRESFQYPSAPPLHPHADVSSSSVSAPTSPAGFNSSSLWQPTAPVATHDQANAPTGTASLMFRALTGRSSRRMTRRQSKPGRRCSSAPSSPDRDSRDSRDDEIGRFHMDSQPSGEYGFGSQPSSPERSRGSVTFLTVKNLLRGGGALARTVRREQPNRRPTCMGTELTISSRLKRREKFQRPTVITDAYHRVSDMKLGTSPMKVKIKHKAFPEIWINGISIHDQEEADPGMPSPKGQLHRESLITLETLDKIGTRHACPVQLIEEPLPDFSTIQPRVDAWNHYKKPKKTLRRPSAWLLGATATSTPPGLHDY